MDMAEHTDTARSSGLNWGCRSCEMAKQPDVPHPLLKCFLFFPLKHKAILPFCISFFFAA